MKMKGKFTYIVASILFVLAIAMGGCRQFSIYDGNDAKLEFSTDTLTFDTVFTTRGSSTEFFKIFNPYNQSLEISQIRLAGGKNSPFRINVDGIPGVKHEDITIAPKDSLYIFAEVTIDPTNQNNPFLVRDSVEFVTNGNLQDVKLLAYGQNAYFHNQEILCDETWNNDKPHVLVGFAAVDSNCTLTITEGTRIYGSKGSFLLVAGKLEILGTQDSMVTFQGDRLEPFFDDLPGQWQGIIVVRGSKNNLIRHADINEAVSGVINGSTLADINSNAEFDQEFNAQNVPDVTLENVIIRNAQENGIYSFYGNVDATNCLIHSTGTNSVALLFGGEHNLTHCTIANYGALGLENKDPGLRITNFAVQPGPVTYLRPFDSNVRNSIVYGNIPVDTAQTDGEVSIEMFDTLSLANYYFDHCLLRTNLPASDPDHFNSITTNALPGFNNISEDKYGLTENSPAIDKADPSFSPPFDLNGNPRVGTPDLGALEFQE